MIERAYLEIGQEKIVVYRDCDLRHVLPFTASLVVSTGDSV